MSGMVMSESINLIEAVFGEISDDLHAALELGAEAMVDESTMLVPIDTGALHESIHVEWTSDRSFDFIADATNDSGEEYGPFIEWGTRFMTAQPFFEPGYEHGIEVILEQVDEIGRKY